MWNRALLILLLLNVLSDSKSTALRITHARSAQCSTFGRCCVVGRSSRTGISTSLKEHLVRPFYTVFKGIERLLGWTSSITARFLPAPLKRSIAFIDKELPMLRYLWPKDDGPLSQEFSVKASLLGAFIFMYLSKWINLQVPFLLQRAVDGATKVVSAAAVAKTNEVIPLKLLGQVRSLLLLYCLTRVATIVAAEVKTCFFSYTSQSVIRRFARQIFSHLHSLDSEFHLRTPSGTISVAYVRAVRGFQTLLLQLVFYVFPALLELVMVAQVLFVKFGASFAAVTLGTFAFYLAFTIAITEFRVAIRKELVEVDNRRNGFFIDSILNHEVVKLFTNEGREISRFDGFLKQLQDLSIKTTYSIAALNVGQTSMFGLGLFGSLALSLTRVASGTMSVGDLVAINSMLLQLSVPFNYIGYTYQEMRQAYVDMKYITNVIVNVRSSITSNRTEDERLPSIEQMAPRSGPSLLEFRNVSCRYGLAEDEPLLKNVSFMVKPGQNVAIVGPSGSGKSTTLRLITRMLDPSDGVVLLDGIDIKCVSLVSLRDRVSVVPQDTSLFDNTVEYNIKYGMKTEPSADILSQVLKNCSLDETISKLPNGLQTQVGERGAVLSGGERQKVSIARALLKDPTLILCDEVTSAVDAFAERDIVELLKRTTASRTTLTVAHRLSSIAHCDNIIVMDKGDVVEQGSHSALLNKEGSLYRRLWEAQNGISASRNSFGDKAVSRFVQRRYSQIQRILSSQLRKKRFQVLKDSDSNALYAAVRDAAEQTTTNIEPLRGAALLQGKDSFGASQELTLMELRLLEGDRERERARQRLIVKRESGDSVRGDCGDEMFEDDDEL